VLTFVRDTTPAAITLTNSSTVFIEHETELTLDNWYIVNLGKPFVCLHSFVIRQT
jgi:hypothetical protein